jgi:hypothetical protein
MWKLGIFLAVTLGGGLLTAIGKSLNKSSEELEKPLTDEVRRRLVEELTGRLRTLHETQEKLSRKRKELQTKKVRSRTETRK